MKLGDLVERLGGRLEGGDRAAEVRGVGSLLEAEPHEVSFLTNARYQHQIEETRALAVFVAEDWAGPQGAALIRVADPNRAFADAAVLLSPSLPTYPPGIHPTAVIAEGASLGPDVHIGPFCIIASGAAVGARCVLVGHCQVEEGAVLGEESVLHAHVTIRRHCQVGARVRLHNGAVVGSDGFGYTHDDQGHWHKIAQLGIVEIGDDVEIGANTTIDRARFGKTRIGAGTKIDNLVQIAHNVQVGEDVVMASQVGISGSTRIARGVQIGGQAGLAGHLEIGAGAVIGAQAGVTKDVAAGVFVSGYPAMEHRRAARLHAHTMQLPSLRERVRALEQHLGMGKDAGTR